MRHWGSHLKLGQLILGLHNGQLFCADLLAQIPDVRGRLGCRGGTSNQPNTVQLLVIHLYHAMAQRHKGCSLKHWLGTFDQWASLHVLFSAVVWSDRVTSISSSICLISEVTLANARSTAATCRPSHKTNVCVHGPCTLRNSCLLGTDPPLLRVPCLPQPRA